MSENKGKPVSLGVKVVDAVLIALVVIPVLACCVLAMVAGS